MLTSLLLSVATGCIDYSFGGNKDELGGADDTGHTATGTIEWPPDSECDIELPEPYEVGLTDLCEYDVGAFNPIAEWTVGQGKFSWAAAAVADLDGDGAPEVVTTFADSPFGTGDSLMPTGYLVAFRGDGTPYWEVRDFPLGMSSSPAVVDVDADGTPEIFVVREYANSMLADGDYTLLMLDAQGQLIWESEHFLGVDFDYATSVSVSDMDHDGSPEIVAGRIIFNVDGTVRGEGEHGRGSYGVMVDPIFGLTVTEATSPAIADLDLDGEEEVITGNAFYDADGNTVWYDPYQEDGMIAVANLDDDPEGEFVASSYNTIRAVDTDGTILWGPKNIRSANIMSPAAIGDIDEDGYPEIITAGGNKLLALNHDGSPLWTADVTDETGATGASIFDFEGDGIPEVVYIDEVEMVAYDGPTGAVKFYNADHSSNTMMDCPVIADVDADGHVEILVAHANFNTALSAFGDRDDSWAPARKLWNQHRQRRPDGAALRHPELRGLQLLEVGHRSASRRGPGLGPGVRHLRGLRGGLRRRSGLDRRPGRQQVRGRAAGRRPRDPLRSRRGRAAPALDPDHRGRDPGWHEQRGPGLQGRRRGPDRHRRLLAQRRRRRHRHRLLLGVLRGQQRLPVDGALLRVRRPQNTARSTSIAPKSTVRCTIEARNMPRSTAWSRSRRTRTFHQVNQAPTATAAVA